MRKLVGSYGKSLYEKYPNPESNPAGQALWTAYENKRPDAEFTRNFYNFHYYNYGYFPADSAKV